LHQKHNFSLFQNNLKFKANTLFNSSITLAMPLVVPGLMSNNKDKNDDWQNKLMGKKLGDTSDEIVCQSISANYSDMPILMEVT
jgi:hypothetical protein